MLRRTLLVFATAWFVAVPVAPAAASGSLTVPAASGLSGSGVQVAANRSGFAVAVWRAPARRGHAGAFRSASRRPGGSWSKPASAVRIPAGAGFHLLRLVVDDHATSHLLWSVSAKGKGSGHLYVATRRRTGRWSKPSEVGPATVGKTLDVVEKADLAVSPSGTESVLWVAGGNDENVIVYKKPAVLGVQTRPPGERWRKPSVLFRGQNAASVELQVDRRGNALATWTTQPPEIDFAPARFSYRRAGGHWTRSRPLPDLADNGLTAFDRPTLVGGAIHLFGEDFQGSTGTEVGPYARLSGSGATSVPETVALPSEAARSGGWLGAGSTQASAVTVDGRGRPTVVFPTAGADLPTGGGLGTSVLWSSTRTASGSWEVESIDEFREASEPFVASDAWSRPSVAIGRDGRVVATWNVTGPSKAPCSVETFQSTHATTGWTRRVLVGEFAGSSCRGTALQPIGLPTASLAWAVTSKQLRIRAVPSRPPAASAPQVRLVTSTWASIRAANAIEFECQAPGGGVCHVSLIPAERDPDALDALEGFCRPTLAAAAVSDRTQKAVVRFPLAADCYAGGPLPDLRAGGLTFPVLAVHDDVGRTSTGATVSVEVTG